jgi:hypothetical protein
MKKQPVKKPAATEKPVLPTYPQVKIPELQEIHRKYAGATCRIS